MRLRLFRMRTLLMILLLLIGGAIINIAVAWGIGASLDTSMPGAEVATAPEPGSQSQNQKMQYEGRIIVFKFSSRHAIRTRSSWLGAGVGPNEFALSLIPDWAQQLSPQNSDDANAAHFALAWEYGWPAISFGGSSKASGQSAPSGIWKMKVDYDYAVAIRPSLINDPSTHLDVRLLVYRPLWPGFAINTIFYAIILWLLFAGPFVLRRWRRTKRGLCPKCAYPIGVSDTCTECGRPVRR